MKAIIILGILITFGVIFFTYSKTKDIKKLLLSLGTFTIILSLGVVGNMTRPVLPLYLSHILLILVSWGALIVYIVRDRYYWWIIFSPAVTIVLFLLLEFISGSGHEVG